MDVVLQAAVDAGASLPYWLVAAVVGALVSVIVYQDRRIAQINEQRRQESVEATKAAIATAEANRAQAEASKDQIDVLNRTVDLIERLGGLKA